MRYVATFEPQAWINDNVVFVDPPGPTQWDCTEFIKEEFDEQQVNETIERNGFMLDCDDVLVNDNDAPAWIREWNGPFTITITKTHS